MDEDGAYYYSLDYLRGFFQNQIIIDANGFYSLNGGTTLSAEEVIEKLPGIVQCSDKYAYFHVQGGGRYFVFWMKAYALDNLEEEAVFVQHASYIPATIDSTKGESLQRLSSGLSVLQDVIHIDPDLELSNSLSSCDLITYSLIDFSSVLEIRYSFRATDHCYIVDSIKINPLESSSSLFSYINKSDFPDTIRGRFSD